MLGTEGVFFYNGYTFSLENSEVTESEQNQRRHACWNISLGNISIASYCITSTYTPAEGETILSSHQVSFALAGSTRLENYLAFRLDPDRLRSQDSTKQIILTITNLITTRLNYLLNSSRDT